MAIRFDIEKLQNEEMVSKHVGALEEQILLTLIPHQEGASIEVKWNQLKVPNNTVAEKTIGYEHRRKRNEWFDEEKNAADKRCLERPTRTKRGIELRPTADKIYRKMKRKHIKDKII